MKRVNVHQMVLGPRLAGFFDELMAITRRGEPRAAFSKVAAESLAHRRGVAATAASFERVTGRKPRAALAGYAPPPLRNGRRPDVADTETGVAAEVETQVSAQRSESRAQLRELAPAWRHLALLIVL